MVRGRRGDIASGVARRSSGAGRRRGAAVACAVAVGVLAACSSDAGGTATDGGAASSVPAATSTVTSTVAAPAPAAQAVTVTAREMEFALDDTELPAGEWTITLTNQGRMTHDLVVEQDGDDIAATDPIGPGESTTLTVTLMPGRYVVYCSLGDHRAMGMETEVTVS